MNIVRKKALLYGLITAIWGAQVYAQPYIPWDALTQDSWIDSQQPVHPMMHPSNDSNSYPIAFLWTTSDSAYSAKGMNALKFVFNGDTNGHLVSTNLTGSFAIKHNGNNNIFTHVFIVLAVNTDFLNPDFSVSLNLQDVTACLLDSNDFGYYDNPFGRPSGYYSETDPNHDKLAYAFETGMVTVYQVEGMSPLVPQQSITINYSFEYLPGPAVFSVYGFVGTNPDPDIYHTNRSLIDNNNPNSPVSTFAVSAPGDLNKDLKVDFIDFAMLAQNWLTTADYSDLAQLAHDWLFGVRQ
jgi:hypothetical protein